MMVFLKVDLSTFPVFHSALVENLEKKLEHVGMRFLNFIQQHHRIGPAADRFGEDAALSISDVSWRRAFQRRHGVRFLEFRHVDGDHVALASVKQIREGERRFCFSHAAGTDKKENADRLLGILHAGAGSANALGDRFHRVILPDDARAQVIFESQNRLDFVLHHLAGGDAGPRGNHFTDDMAVHANAHQRIIALQRVQFGIELCPVPRAWHAVSPVPSSSPLRSSRIFPTSADFRRKTLFKLGEPGRNIRSFLPGSAPGDPRDPRRRLLRA